MTTTYTVTIAPTSDVLTPTESARLDRYDTELTQWLDARRGVNARPSHRDPLPFASVLPYLVAATNKAAEDLCAASGVAA